MVKTLTTTSLAGTGVALILGVAALLGRNQLEDLRTGFRENKINQQQMAITIEQMKAADAILLVKMESIEKEIRINGGKLDRVLDKVK